MEKNARKEESPEQQLLLSNREDRIIREDTRLKGIMVAQGVSNLFLGGNYEFSLEEREI